MTSNTIKEYYIKLEKLWTEGLNLLTGLNQSLSSNTETINIVSVLDDKKTYTIPAFKHLENKLDTLSSNFSNIFKLPESGKAYIVNNENTNTFELQMIKNGVSAVTPEISTSEKFIASITDNNILKDMVLPKTYLKLNISNLPENVEKMMMRKYIFFNSSLFDSLKAASENPNFDINAYIYNFKRGTDYDVYDSELSLPLKQNKYIAEFIIEEVKENIGNKIYSLQVNTLKYVNSDDPSIEYKLKEGDKLSLGNTSSIFKVLKTDTTKNEIKVEEIFSHNLIRSYDEDSSMKMTIYQNDFSEFHYIKVPLEENPYIALQFSTIQNNVRSNLSAPLFVNLNEIEMTNEYGQPIYDDKLNKINYIQYYEKFCVNVGDLILGLTESAYPQLSNLSNYQLDLLQNDPTIQSLASKSIDENIILKVLPINKHIIDNSTTEELIRMHAQKNELNSQINAINDNIADTNTTLTTTDFTQNTEVTQNALQSQLTKYYNDKIVLQKQLIGLVENININAGQIDGKSIKYRIRGLADCTELENYIKSTYSEKLDLIGIDVEYKYKSLNKDTTSVLSINSSIFTDWNKLSTIDKQRIVKVNNAGGFILEFENYNATNNIIKWNQIDIPISADEDVVIRIRYKYNIGQPFINVYSPWSDEITVVFPVEYKDNVEVNTIISENQNDLISTKFNSTLINDGYTEHISNSIKSQDITFYHAPENIYSGFNTSENSMISLKDKLLEMQKAIDKYQDLIESELNRKYQVYISYDDKQIELFANKSNTLTIYNNDHIIDSFVKKNMSLIFKNIGETPIRMYSIFPGNISTPLIFCTDSYYEKYLVDYERVPVLSGETMEYQRLGQWIYFRQNNPWTSKDIYFDNLAQNKFDWLAPKSTGCSWNSTNCSNLMKTDYNQVLFGYRKRNSSGDTYHMNSWRTIYYDKNKNTFITNSEIKEIVENKLTIEEKYSDIDKTFFMYKNVANDYLMRFEDIFYDENGMRFYLDSQTSLTEFVSQHYVPGNFTDDIDFVGAFLYPELPSINNILTNGSVGDYIEIPVGGTLNVPITFEFYLNQDLTSVTKGLYFDIKPSAYSEALHYMLDITALYDFTSSGNVLGNISLIDEVTE